MLQQALRGLRLTSLRAEPAVAPVACRSLITPPDHREEDRADHSARLDSCPGSCSSSSPAAAVSSTASTPVPGASPVRRPPAPATGAGAPVVERRRVLAPTADEPFLGNVATLLVWPPGVSAVSGEPQRRPRTWREATDTQRFQTLFPRRPTPLVGGALQMLGLNPDGSEASPSGGAGGWPGAAGRGSGGGGELSPDQAVALGELVERLQSLQQALQESLPEGEELTGAAFITLAADPDPEPDHDSDRNPDRMPDREGRLQGAHGGGFGPQPSGSGMSSEEEYEGPEASDDESDEEEEQEWTGRRTRRGGAGLWARAREAEPNSLGSAEASSSGRGGLGMDGARMVGRAGRLVRGIRGGGEGEGEGAKRLGRRLRSPCARQQAHWPAPPWDDRQPFQTAYGTVFGFWRLCPYG
ncbi:hypothetical protein HYH03_016912 [Edaphochlamys debaryana]|uniref:Uncharacterized protein n=1 Tax=Edaphochlamys debaryana TaxID=47281 RepID=A0A835XK30_9CHLO|nr:hypothetical protein HYH03_016912 [Edaphochlamys debaryana]|eukprot:KAG2484268.1 hypothetical protein HYH03_016912 [Edaphochlamys debaryana]